MGLSAKPRTQATTIKESAFMLSKFRSTRTRSSSREINQRKRFSFESLENRALLASDVSIGDATAIEGSDALKFIDRFIADGSGGIDRPRASTFGPDGNGDGASDLYVPSVDSDEVLRYDGVTGAFLDVFISAGSGGLDSPGDLEFSPDGLLYVTSYVNNVLPHDNDGQLLRYDGTTGAFIDVAASGLYSPLGIALAPDGNLYIANETSNEVLRYDGSTMSVFVAAGSGGLAAPRNAIFGPDGNGDGKEDLYVSSANSGGVLRYDGESGVFIDTFATTGLGSGPLWMQFGVDGLLYVTARTTTTSLDTTLVRFNSDSGNYIDSFNIGRDCWSFQIGPDGVVYLSGNGFGNILDRIGPSALAAFTVTLSSASESAVTVNYNTADGTAVAASDYVVSSGTLTFAPGQTSRTILVQTIDDAISEFNETFSVVLSNPQGAVITDGTGIATILDNDSTKFYVVNDATQNLTYEYDRSGGLVESYSLGSANTAPRGAASTAAGDKTWVVDANKKVYVYNNSGALLGSWTAGGLHAQAQLEGIATNGADVWIVDAKQDRVYRYTGAASRLSGSQNSASSFALNSGNKDPKDIVTDGVYLWVVNNSTTDKVFKYTLSGSLVGSWTISSGGGSPTGITIDPANVSDIWIVDNATDRVYQYTAAASRTSGSQSPATSFALAAGNTNPQGIADPPVASVVLHAENPSLPGMGVARYTTPFADLERATRHTLLTSKLRAIDFVFEIDDDAISRRKSRITRAIDALRSGVA
jgi:hypothetical protein